MHWFSIVFLIFLFASTAVRLWLGARQTAAVRRHRDGVPTPFVEKISPDDHRKAADYTLALGRIDRVDTVLDAVVLIALTLGGGLALIEAFWIPLALPSPWHGATVVLSVMLGLMLAGLPLSVWRTFGVESRFGFNRTTPRLFVADLLKQLALGLLLGGPLLLAVLWLMESAGTLWWLYAWLLWTAFTVLISWAYPAVIAPLFNKFSPLSDQALAERVGNLLTRCGFASKGVFVMDGSARSTHGNAYFTGLGRNKRIVFFDTLIERLAPSEIEAVLAHELGHYSLHHVRTRLVVSLIMSFAGLALLGWLSTWPPFYQALGVTQPSTHAALLLFILASSPFAYFITPLSAAWSRRHEFEADDFAARHASAAELGTALVKLYRDNASTLTPDRLHSAFYDSHPPALIRIAHLEKLAAARP